jgi:hypothetical protein
MYTITLDSTPQNIDPAQLDSVTGGFDLNRMVDNGNRYGAAGAIVGGGVGAGVGGVLGAGVGGAAGAGVGAIPGWAVGAATGAGVGGAAGGALGWVGGAATDAWNQVRGQ